jgi:AcrR family transcriptional regulator
MRGRPLGFDREQALDTALRLFWERGYDTTSITELTRAMGISAPSLYAAFGDKRRLFVEATDRYQASYGAFADRALTEEPTARAAVERLLCEAANAYVTPHQPRGCLVLTSATNCTPASAEVHDDLRRRRQTNLRALQRAVTRDITVGRLPADTDAHQLALFYGAILQGMSQQARDGGTRNELLGVAEASLDAWPDPKPTTNSRP